MYRSQPVSVKAEVGGAHPLSAQVVYPGHPGALISGLIQDKQDFPASQASAHIRNIPGRLRSKGEALEWSDNPVSSI